MSRVFERDDQWWIDFKDAQGVRHRKKIGPSKRVAKEILDDTLGRVARRQHLGIIEESPSHSLNTRKNGGPESLQL
jgi:hypothetical protein